MSSVHAVASKYGGSAKFEVDSENNVFKVSILLKNNKGYNHRKSR
ncbi:ATP-binding protein [Clostridium gelidum]|nr:ATP-binding protein [Clostridium gelidum]